MMVEIKKRAGTTSPCTNFPFYMNDSDSDFATGRTCREGFYAPPAQPPHGRTPCMENITGKRRGTEDTHALTRTAGDAGGA